MRKILFLLLIAPFCAAHAQETKKQTVSQKLSIGFNFSPDYSYRTLNNSGSSSTDIVVTSRNNLEVAKFGYTTGLNICFNLSKTIEFETGIQYSNKGYQIKNRALFYLPPIDPALPKKAETIYSYQYIGIPLRVKLTAGENKIRFLSSAGFMTNFLLKARQKTIFEYSDGNTTKSTQSMTDFNKVEIAPMISVGVKYIVNEKTQLTAEPTFRYGMTQTKDATISEHLWSAGLNIGLYYRLN
jgi:hypothetical protein